MFSRSAPCGGGGGGKNFFFFLPGPKPALGGPSFSTVSETKEYDGRMQLSLFVLTFVEFVENYLKVRHLSANFAGLQSF